MLKVACWNVCTMQDFEDNNRPQRHAALVATELARLDVDIAAVSEVRFAEQGSLTEHGAGMEKGKKNADCQEWAS